MDTSGTLEVCVGVESWMVFGELRKLSFLKEVPGESSSFGWRGRRGSGRNTHGDVINHSTPANTTGGAYCGGATEV